MHQAEQIHLSGNMQSLIGKPTGLGVGQGTVTPLGLPG